MVFVTIMLQILLVKKPYLNKSDDQMHLFVQIEIFLFLLCGYVFSTISFNDNRKAVLFDYAMSIILMVICLLLFSIFIYRAYRFIYKIIFQWWYVDFSYGFIVVTTRILYS